MGRNMYQNWATLDVGVQKLRIVPQNVFICSGVHQSRYETREDSPYDDGVYALQ